jgi:hypothetical protein
MPAIVTNKFRLNNAENFRESFTETNPNYYYLGIGRIREYGTFTRPDGRTDFEGTETIPETPGDSVINEFNNFDELIAAKRITGNDVSLVCPRRNWISGTVYDMYRHDYEEYVPNSSSTRRTSNSGATTLFDASYYVLTTARNVYKCLDNNGGAASTVEPTGTSTTPFVITSDGYRWKYIYTLSAAQQVNFLSTDFMPVATDSTIAAAATDGRLDVVSVANGGTGFTINGGGSSGIITGVPIRGDYSANGGSAAECEVTIQSGIVTSINITSNGSGYTYAYITDADIIAGTNAGGTGSGAELDVIIPPKGGHGSNAPAELGAFFVMMTTTLEGTENANSLGTGDFSAANDFRKISLIKDPTDANGTNLTDITARATFAVKLSASPSPGTFLVDEEINQATTGATGKVVEWDSSNNILYFSQFRHNDAGVSTSGDQIPFSGSGVISAPGSSATGTPDISTQTINAVSFVSGYSAPEIKHDSGDILYVENRVRIARAIDQTENIKLIIEF